MTCHENARGNPSFHETNPLFYIKAVAGAKAPTPTSQYASKSTSNHVWTSSTGFRLTGTRALLLGSPRAPRKAVGGEGHLTFKFHQIRYVTQKLHFVVRHLGLQAKSDWGNKTTVRCTSMKPANTNNPITAHAPPCTHDNNFNVWKHPSEIMPISLNTKDLERLSDKPKRDTTRTILQGE